MRQSIILASVVLVLAACGGGGSSGGTEASGSGGGGGGEATAAPLTGREACTASMVRERECSADFIPALVALRVRLDLPSGISARDGAEGRDALVAEANAEWARDATDENIATNCAQMDELPADQATQWTDMMNGCLATDGCAAFVECDVRFTEARFTAPH